MYRQLLVLLVMNSICSTTRPVSVILCVRGLLFLLLVVLFLVFLLVLLLFSPTLCIVAVLPITQNNRDRPPILRFGSTISIRLCIVLYRIVSSLFSCRSDRVLLALPPVIIRTNRSKLKYVQRRTIIL